MGSAIIVFSHLRWDSEFHRPQQLLSRLARRHPIVFIEEPVRSNETFLKTTLAAPGVLVCQPRTPVDMPGFHDDHLPHLRKLVRQLGCDYEEHIAWVYAPMALPLLHELQPGLVVYDVAEPAFFKDVPKQFLQRESALLKLADIVFTDGPSRRRSMLDRHPNVHCVPSSVDASHFELALDCSNSHPAHRSIPGPRMGFYGVIDERFDAELIRRVANAHSQWQIVLVGPVMNIDPATLPRLPNIHYIGQQAYGDLPRLLAGWDVCLLPFASNDATRFVNPIETLEYMAAELPIVSTPLADVVEYYSGVVAIADGAPAFIAACERALLATPEQRASMVSKMRAILAATSWDATVEQIGALLAIAQRRPDAGATRAGAAPSLRAGVSWPAIGVTSR